jgi:hypothetical protein
VVVEYVMVPVPEELAEQVLTYVSWRDAQAKAGPPVDEQPDDGDAIARVFARLDGPSRGLVAVIATAALEGEELGIPTAARRAGVATREALGILLEVNNILAGEGRPPITFGWLGGGGPPEGEFTWDAFVAVMPAALAPLFVDLARSQASA